MRGPSLDLKSRISDRIGSQAATAVWTPVDFLDLGPRDAVDKALQRLARGGAVRRIDRGLYDQPRINQLTGKSTVADYRAIIEAIGRRDQTRMLIDGMTAANDLGLSDAVPGRVVVHTDARLRPIELDKLRIEFRPAAPSKLFWAGRPAMRVVQALHWLRGPLSRSDDRGRLMKQLQTILTDPVHGAAIQADLREGLPTLPAWMHAVVRGLLEPDGDDQHPDDDQDRRRRRQETDRSRDQTKRPLSSRLGHDNHHHQQQQPGMSDPSRTAGARRR